MLPILINREKLEAVCFHLAGTAVDLHHLPRGRVNFLALEHNFVYRDLDCFAILQDLICSTNNIVLLESKKQEVDRVSESLPTHACQRWERNPTKVLGPDPLVKFLGIQSSGKGCNSFFEMKGK